MFGIISTVEHEFYNQRAIPCTRQIIHPRRRQPLGRTDAPQIERKCPGALLQHERYE